MIGGKGGLGVKDYPFAISLATLIFPPILTNDGNLNSIFLITIVGGSIGSILTITNFFGGLTKYISLLFYGKILQDIRKTIFVEQIVKQGYFDSFKMPSISYEIDKLVGIFYFLIILGLSIYRLQSDDFIKIIQITEEQQLYAIVVLSIGVIVVIYSLILNVKGDNSTSYLKKLHIATTSYVVRDFMNLSNDKKQILEKYCHGNSGMIAPLITQFKKFQNKNSDYDSFKKDFDDSKLVPFLPTAMKLHYDREAQIKKWWEAFPILLSITKKYRITDMNELTIWFKTKGTFEPTNLDSSLTQLQTSIEARDWRLAEINTERILSHVKLVLESKNMLQN